jgi:predicted metal-dependent phosphoesterase TrpH
MERVLSRRTLLRAAGVAGLGVPLLSGCTSPAPRRVPTGGTGDPIAVAMHLHTSFSEGTASMAAHLEQAQRLGVDVLFWTDHDFRVSAQGYRRRLGLGGPTDSEHGVEVTWKQRTEGAATGDVSYGAGAATLTARGQGAFWLDANAWNSTYSGSIADTALEVEVRPASAGGYAAVQLDLSYHPASGGRPAARYRVTYRIGASPQIAWRATGSEGEVDVPAPPGWSTVKLRPVDDIGGLWPDLVAEDNALHRLRVGVVGTGSAAFREVRISRSRRDDSLALMRDVMSRYAERYPERRQYAALEVSLVRHLNWFGGELVMPDYGDRAPVKDDSIPAAEAMVGLIHRHGGLASYNHPLGGDVPATAAHMVATRALGADILEVAYGGPSIVDGMLAVLDACARNMVLVTANGVTDDHSGTDWYADGKSNWITRLWARSAELPDLQDALQAGRAWAYKPNKWDGTLETSAADRPAMGSVVVTSGTTVPVAVTATELPRGGALEVVTGRVDRAAAAPAITTVRAGGGTHSLDLVPDSYVRAVVRDAAGLIVGLGNPLWVTRDAAAVPAARRMRV